MPKATAIETVNDIGTTIHPHTKTMKLDPYCTQHMKINSRWVTDLDVRVKAIKLTEGNIGINLYDLAFGKGFLEYQEHKWQNQM